MPHDAAMEDDDEAMMTMRMRRRKVEWTGVLTRKWVQLRLGMRRARFAAAGRPRKEVRRSSVGRSDRLSIEMSRTRVLPNPVGSAQPATSVAGPSFAGRSGHDGRFSADRSSDAPPTPRSPARRR